MEKMKPARQRRALRTLPVISVAGQTDCIHSRKWRQEDISRAERRAGKSLCPCQDSCVITRSGHTPSVARLHFLPAIEASISNGARYGVKPSRRIRENGAHGARPAAPNIDITIARPSSCRRKPCHGTRNIWETESERSENVETSKIVCHGRPFSIFRLFAGQAKRGDLSACVKKGEGVPVAAVTQP